VGAVWGPTGAPGRTTVAVNVAAELARAGVPTLLVDADTYGACVAQTLGLLDEAPGVAAATRAADQGTLDVVALARIAPEASARLRVLTGLPRADRWPELREHAFTEVLSTARQLAQVTVIDCGFCLEDDEDLSYDTQAPRRNAATLAALAEADAVLAVGSAEPVGLQRLVRGLQDLAAVVSAPPPVVVNKVRVSAVGSDAERRVAEALERFAGVTDPWFVPDDRPALDAAMLAGRALCEVSAGSAARRSIAELAGGLVGLEPPARRRRLRRS
jgi:MinD-like ATPase involved in chromosome partitioning or flagellar assembly